MPTLNDLVGMAAGNPYAGVTDSLHQGVQLAQQKEQLEQQKQQVAQMKQQADQANWDSFQKRVGVAMAAPKSVQNKLFDQVAQWMDKNGMDSTIAEAMKDTDYQSQLSKALVHLRNNPIDASDGIAALGSWATFNPAVANLIEKQMSMQQSHDDKMATLDVTKRGQDMTLQGKQIMGGIRLDNAERNAVKDLTTNKQVTTIQSSIMQAKKDNDLIQESREHGLTPLKATELVQSYVSLLKGMSANSTGSEREELAHAAQDAEQKINALKQKWGTMKGLVKYQDEPFLHDIETSIRGLHSTLKGNLNQSLNERLRTSGLESVNNAQQAAYNTIMDGAELDYKPGKKSASTGQMAPAEAPTAPTPKPTPIDLNAYVGMLKGKKSAAEIKQFLVTKGHTEAEINSALKAQGL